MGCLALDAQRNDPRTVERKIRSVADVSTVPRIGLLCRVFGGMSDPDTLVPHIRTSLANDKDQTNSHVGRES